MSTFPQLSFHKLPTAEEASFAQLPLYTRGLGKMLLTYCDDQGRIALGKRSPADAVAWRCGADRNDRRKLAEDLQTLVEVGYIRIDAMFIVVVDQERDFKSIESVRSSKRGAGSRPRSSHSPTTYGQLTNHSPTTLDVVTSRHVSDPFCREEKRREEKTKEDQRREEGVQGEQAPYAPKTDPTPTLRRTSLSNKLNEALGKGPACMEGTDDGAYQDVEPKDQVQTPTPRPAVPAPGVGRQATFVAVVDPKPVQSPAPPVKSNVGPGKGASPKPAKPKGKTSKVATQEGEPLPDDWKPNDNHYELGYELGLSARHVDYFADEMRDRAASDGILSGNWNAKFRNWLRKGMEFRKNVPPALPPPREPKRPMPPAPPPEPMVLEASARWGERMKNGETFDMSRLKQIGMKLPPLDPTPVDL